MDKIQEITLIDFIETFGHILYHIILNLTRLGLENIWEDFNLAGIKTGSK